MINKVIILGNVGADPEVHTFESGNKVVRFRVATTERIFNPATNEWGEHTEWHTVVAGQRHANFLETYMRKGAQVYVEGKLRRREWGDGDDKRFFVEIRADEVRLLGRRGENGNQPSQPQGYGAPQSTPQSSPQSAPQSAPQSSPQSQPSSAPQSTYGQNSYGGYSTPSQPSGGFSAEGDDQSDDIPF